jgi:spermidine/putrescine transport system ATP-binding protein
MTNYILSIQNVTRSFGDFIAIDQFSLDIEEGELVTLLGPSGCGKTTLLRIIAGFEVADSGKILLEGRDMHHVPAYQRPVNMVFQKYSLFPHLNVFENIAFGLRLKRLPHSQIAEKVQSMLELVRLPGFEYREVAKLSGGELQRIALARALIMDPKVLLLDEPLGALDLMIRKEMEIELKRIHVKLGATFLYVTHDQEEAMTVSDRIVIMKRGKIVQLGTPSEIYTTPINTFCASFVGESNLFQARIVGMDFGTATVTIGDVRINARVHPDIQVDQECNVLIRPEVISVYQERQIGMSENELYGDIVDTIFLGSSVFYHVDVKAPSLLVVEEHVKGGYYIFQREERVIVGWSANDTLLLVA